MSAAWSPTTQCRRLLRLAKWKRAVFVISQPLLDELEEKLIGKFRWPIEKAARGRGIVRRLCSLVAHGSLSAPISRDPDDDVVLAAAKAGRCDFLVTGDGDLLVLREFEGIRILSPREFEQILAE